MHLYKRICVINFYILAQIKYWETCKLSKFLLFDLDVIFWKRGTKNFFLTVYNFTCCLNVNMNEIRQRRTASYIILYFPVTNDFVLVWQVGVQILAIMLTKMIIPCIKHVTNSELFWCQTNIFFSQYLQDTEIKHFFYKC